MTSRMHIRPSFHSSSPLKVLHWLANIGLVGSLLAGHCASAASIFHDFDATRYDRFANDPAFIASGFDLSGVGRTNTSGGRWVTMISPNVYLSAWHFQPALNDTVRFFASNDPLGPSVDRTISSTRQRIGATDLWIGTLDAPLPSGYGHYNIASQSVQNATDFGTHLFGKIALIGGKSQTDFPNEYLNMTFGANVIDAYFGSETVGGATGDAIGEVYNKPTDPLFLSSENYLQGGDSGGPMFTVSGSDLVLTGINWFIGTGDIDPNPFDEIEAFEERNLSGQTYVGNYYDAISGFVSLYSVPEPTTAIFLLVAGGLIGMRRWRF